MKIFGKRLTVYIGTLLGTLLLAVAIAYAWGFTAHKFINKRAVIHLPSSMNSWKADSLFYELHSTDPDTRRDNNDTTFGSEQWRHYIDIDLYPNFQNLPHDIDSVMTLYGYETVKTTGMVPWAIGWVMDSLTAQLARGDAAKAKQSAADLGHYVADSHQPLHVTENYNGQFTGNSGIHSRYESTMINNYSSSLNISPDSIQYVASPVDFAFDYILYTHQYVDSVLDADDYAKAVSGWNGSGTAPGSYYDALWEKTQVYTLALIQKASVDLASLWYTAYVNASAPKFALTPGTINFGSLLVNNSKTDSITISNSGNSTLYLASIISNSAEFTVSSPADSIPPSSNKKFYITFTPQQSGIRTGLITITHSAENSPETLSVNGTGMFTSLDVAVNARWNLISNPLTTDVDSVTVIFPGSLFPYAYSYTSLSGYQQQTLMSNGIGYWEKFSSDETITMFGLPRMVDTIEVIAGWNIIGSISVPVLASAISSIPPGLITSQFFTYNNGYVASDSIKPGKGYWIKVSEDGELILAAPGLSNAEKTITIIPTSELPPSNRNK